MDATGIPVLAITGNRRIHDHDPRVGLRRRIGFGVASKGIELDRKALRVPPLRPSMVDPYLVFIRQILEQHPRLRATRIYHMACDRGYTAAWSSCGAPRRVGYDPALAANLTMIRRIRTESPIMISALLTEYRTINSKIFL